MKRILFIALLAAFSAFPTMAQFDFDGEGKSDILFFRPDGAKPSVGHILGSSSNSAATMQYGIGTDWLVPADYNGDGRAN